MAVATEPVGSVATNTRVCPGCQSRQASACRFSGRQECRPLLETRTAKSGGRYLRSGSGVELPTARPCYALDALLGCESAAYRTERDVDS